MSLISIVSCVIDYLYMRYIRDVRKEEIYFQSFLNYNWRQSFYLALLFVTSLLSLLRTVQERGLSARPSLLPVTRTSSLSLKGSIADATNLQNEVQHPRPQVLPAVRAVGKCF